MHRILLLCALALAAAAGEADPDIVGALDLRRMDIVISDGPTFPPDEVATALCNDPLLVPAAHFFAPRKGLLNLLAERCAIGYQAHGFPSPQVSVRTQGRGPAERLVVRITEGARLRWGTVRISDPAPLSEDALRQRLCAPWRAPDAKADDEPEDPVIVSGEPARFDPYCNRNLTRLIADFYALEGFQDCKPVVRLGEPRDGTVDCLISFAAPPRALLVRGITVTGLTRNRPEAVTAWLERTTGVRVGGPATTALMNRARQALTASGRFLATTLTSTPTPDQPGQVDVVLDAIDDQRLPLIEEALTQNQRDALALRERILGGLDDGTLSFSVASAGPEVKGRWHLLINARRGCLVRAAIAEPQAMDALIGFIDHHAFYHSHRLARSAGVPWSVFPQFILGLQTNGDREQPNSMNFQIAASSKSKGRLTDLTVTPAFVLLQIAKAERVDDRLIATKDGTVTTFDLTGEIPFSTAGKAKDGNGFWDVRITRAPWPELVQQAGDVSAEALVAAPDTGVSGLVQLASDDLLPLIAREADLDEAALRLWVTAGTTMLSSLWGALPDTQDEEERETYHIPVDLPPEQMVAQLVFMARKVILESTRDLWPSASWPTLIINEVCAVTTGRGEHTRDLLRHLVDGKNMGPVGHVVLASLLSFLDPRLSRVIAGLGENHLNADEWAQDLVILMPNPPPVRSALLAFTDPETAARALPETHRAAFIDLVRRAGRELTPAEEREFLRDAARLLWQAGGERWMRTWLHDLGTEPAATGAIPP